jgi:hypothetical protein
VNSCQQQSCATTWSCCIMTWRKVYWTNKPNAPPVWQQLRRMVHSWRRDGVGFGLYGRILNLNSNRMPKNPCFPGDKFQPRNKTRKQDVVGDTFPLRHWRSLICE